MSDKGLYEGDLAMIKTVFNGENEVADGNKRERITIRLTKRYLDLLNLLIERGVYNSRNESHSGCASHYV